MPLNFNGASMETVFMNGVQMDKVFMNGTEVYTSSVPIPTTRLGAWVGSPTDFDNVWRVKDLANIGSASNGRTAKIVLVYKTAATGTTYQGDIQIDLLRYGGTTFNMDLGELWVRDINSATGATGTYSANLGANTPIGTGVSNEFWGRDANATGSSGTGTAIPQFGGYAIYPETSGTTNGDVFWCESPSFTYNESASKDIFLAMDGQTCGTLTVYIVDDETTDFTPSFSSPDSYYPVVLPDLNATWVWPSNNHDTTVNATQAALLIESVRNDFPVDILVKDITNSDQEYIMLNGVFQNGFYFVDYGTYVEFRHNSSGYHGLRLYPSGAASLWEPTGGIWYGVHEIDVAFAVVNVVVSNT